MFLNLNVWILKTKYLLNSNSNISFSMYLENVLNIFTSQDRLLRTRFCGARTLFLYVMVNVIYLMCGTLFVIVFTISAFTRCTHRNLSGTVSRTANSDDMFFDPGCAQREREWAREREMSVDTAQPHTNNNNNWRYYYTKCKFNPTSRARVIGCDDCSVDEYRSRRMDKVRCGSIFDNA